MAAQRDFPRAKPEGNPEVVVPWFFSALKNPLKSNMYKLVKSLRQILLFSKTYSLNDVFTKMSKFFLNGVFCVGSIGVQGQFIC